MHSYKCTFNVFNKESLLKMLYNMKCFLKSNHRKILTKNYFDHTMIA